MNLNEAISELEDHGYIVELFSPAPLIAASNMAMQNARKREDSTWHRPKKQHSYKEIYNILSKFYDTVDQYDDNQFRVKWTCKKKGVKRADRYTYSPLTNRVGKFNKMADKYIFCCTGDDLEEYLNNGYISERYDLDYDSVNSSFDEEKRLEKFGEYLYEVRELLVRKGFSRGKQADNYDELHDIAHRCCRLGKSIDDCAKEIILTIK